MIPSQPTAHASCPHCGAVDVPARTVSILLAVTSADPFYRFTCPGCYREVQRTTTRRNVMALCEAGARIALVPAEVAERVPDGRAPLREADADAFARALDDADALAALAR